MGKLLTRQTSLNKSCEEALSSRPHTLNAEEGVDIEGRRLVNDCEERNARYRNIPNRDGVCSAPEGEDKLVVGDWVDSDTGREGDGRDAGAAHVRRATRAIEFARLNAGRAFGAREFEGCRAGIEDDTDWLRGCTDYPRTIA